MPIQHKRFGPPEVYGEPPKTGRFWFDLLAATAAIFISVVSLIVAFRGEETQRGLLAANSWPFLQLSKEISPNEDKLDVENSGVGPAKIFTFQAYYKGALVDSAFDLLKKCCGPVASTKSTFPIIAYGSVYNNVLRPGEHIAALAIKAEPTSQMAFDRFTHAMSDLTFEACYCSVLQECWVSELTNLEQRQVSSCPVSKQQFIQGDRPTSTVPSK